MLKNILRQNLINIPGWKTNRKIVVFESDDWGAIRMPSKKVYNLLLNKGIKVDQNYYNRNDALESNRDLEILFETLSKYHDSQGNSPVFTALFVPANPNFDAIKEKNFNEYVFEPSTQTIQRYGNSHNNVPALWQQGLNEHLFYSEFHGREHLNVKRWMNSIVNSKSISRICFNNNFYGLNPQEAGEYRNDYLPAFDLDEEQDINLHSQIIKEGLNLFEEELGYRARFFVAPNSLFSRNLISTLNTNGIRFLSGARRQKEPLGSGKIKTNFNYTGKTNNFSQVYIARNVQFEQGSIYGFSYMKAMQEIANAFKWKNPVIISTHRVNYIGYINPKNRDNGIKELDKLIVNILRKWPNVEFMTTPQLGDLIIESTSKHQN